MMKNRWTALLCGAVCTASLLMSFGNCVGNHQTGKNIAYAAEKTTYDGTYTVPVTDSVKPMEEISIQGVISETDTEDVYLLDVSESAITLTIEGNPEGLNGEMELQTLMGTTLDSALLNERSTMIDTTTALRQSGINNYYLKKGQYLCKISKFGSSKNGELAYTVKAYSVDAASTKTISYGKKYLSYGRNVQYKKINVKKSGKLTIKSKMYKNLSEVYDTQLVNEDGDRFTLCDKNKKELTGSSNGTSKIYGVKKGTYYIKLDSSYRDYRAYSVSFSGAGLAGNKKKSAKTITNKWKSYTMLSTGSQESSAQWYKFTLKKAKKLEVYVNNLTDTNVIVEIYNKNGLDGSIFVEKGTNSGGIYHVQNHKEINWDKGTYYIKVKRQYASSTGGGIVKVKLK